MNGTLLGVFLLSLLTVANPSLLAAVTVMLLLPNPKQLMLGYLLGAYAATITFGILFVFSLPGAGTERTAKHRISPVQDIVLGVLALTASLLLHRRRRRAVQERRQAKKEAKLRAKREAGKPTESLPLRLLGKGDPKVTFVVGVLLNLPGLAYLDTLDHIHRLHAGAVATVVLVLCVSVIQQALLELPLLGYLFAPDRTQAVVSSFRSWIARNGGRAAELVALFIGVVLIGRGVITLL